MIPQKALCQFNDVEIVSHAGPVVMAILPCIYYCRHERREKRNRHVA